MDRDDNKKENKDTKVMDEQQEKDKEGKEKSQHDKEADKIGNF